MRIIAGHLRGRSIDVPRGRGTRPMLDRVREALFSTLAPALEGARVLDLFAGSGSLSLEALSRGADHARLVERDARALALLASNVERLGLTAEVELVRGDALDPDAWGPGEVDIVFLDPPYPWLKRTNQRRALFAAMAALLEGKLAADGRIVFHAPRDAVLEAEFGAGVQLDQRTYGTNALWYVRRAEREDE